MESETCENANKAKSYISNGSLSCLNDTSFFLQIWYPKIVSDAFQCYLGPYN